MYRVDALRPTLDPITGICLARRTGATDSEYPARQRGIITAQWLDNGRRKFLQYTLKTLNTTFPEQRHYPFPSPCCMASGVARFLIVSFAMITLSYYADFQYQCSQRMITVRSRDLIVERCSSLPYQAAPRVVDTSPTMRVFKLIRKARRNEKGV